MRTAWAALWVGLAATAVQAADLQVPAGCAPAAGAKAGFGGYADRIVHEKTGIELVLIPPGDFEMGRRDIVLVGRVNISRPFYLGKTPVTNAQYRRFLSSGYDGARDCDPAYDLHVRHLRGQSLMPAGDDYPVVFVSWQNARAFCQWAGGLDLPTEAQWEYACRAGTTTLYSFGDDPKDVDQYAWTMFNSKASTQPVARLRPNAWGLYDMHGNVWEWCLDDYVGYRTMSRDENAYQADRTVFLDGTITKALRGGSWSNSLVYAVNSTARFNAAPEIAASDIGFRVTMRIQ
ncbi:MAG: formylglycine-generating enzyme family protein [Pirellulales bacterium]|nr:formylglycine-generating enzyme family protein [Pirellulales bacterium]